MSLLELQLDALPLSPRRLYRGRGCMERTALPPLLGIIYC
jgi:hypothetical protein